MSGVTQFFSLVQYAASWQFVIPFVFFFCAWLFASGKIIEAKSLFFTIVATEAFVFIVKIIVNKTRPSGGLVHVEDPWSFPSAHSAIAIVLYGFLIYFLWQVPFLDDWARILISIILALVAVLVAVSRVVLHVHDISDVLGGIVIGIVFFVIGIWYYRQHFL